MNLRRFLTSGFLAHWQLIGLALLLAVIGIQQLRVTGLKSSLTAEKAGRAADRSNYERAQAQAAIDAYAAKMETEKRHEAEREKADARAADLGRDYRAAVLRYQAAQGSASKPHLPVSAETASGGNGPGGPAIVSPGNILIPEADAFTCATNTARLEAVREWALGIGG